MDQLAPLADERREDESVSGGAPEKLLLSPSMQVEQSDLQSATIYLGSTGTRLRVPRALYDLLLKFEAPRSLVSVAGDDVRVASAVARLREKGFLIAEGEAQRPAPARLVTDPPVRLFDCPAQKLAPSRTDVVALGVPYDLSDAAAAGARQGPSALRQTSLQLLYGLDRRSGQPLGWFDADLARPILAGVTIGDCGDVFVDPGERQERLFARIAEALGKVTGGGSLPVLLGGDAAIGFPAIDLLQSSGPLAVVRIGSIASGGGAVRSHFVSPASLPERVLGLPGVTRYVHFGACDRPEKTLPRFEAITAQRLRREGMAAVERCLDDGERVYVGLDLNGLAGPGDAPEGDRFDYSELHSLLRAIGGRCAMAGLDLVGANPLRPGWNAIAMTAVHLLLTGLGAATDGKAREPRP
jgi:agmatinase